MAPLDALLASIGSEGEHRLELEPVLLEQCILGGGREWLVGASVFVVAAPPRKAARGCERGAEPDNARKLLARCAEVANVKRTLVCSDAGVEDWRVRLRTAQASVRVGRFLAVATELVVRLERAAPAAAPAAAPTALSADWAGIVRGDANLIRESLAPGCVLGEEDYVYLMGAIRLGQLECVRAFSERGAVFDRRLVAGITCAHAACASNSGAMLRLVLSLSGAGALAWRDEMCLLPYEHADRPDAEMVALLAELDPARDYVRKYMTGAVEDAREDVVRALLQGLADASRFPIDALNQSVRLGHHGVLGQFLLHVRSAFSDDARLEVLNSYSYGDNALTEAVMFRDAAAVRMLMAEGAGFGGRWKSTV